MAVVILAVLAFVLPPFINVGRYKGRVVASISSALGRPVTADSLELRLLPQPGFYMENLAVGDDPAYSAEPILHADSVTAYLRLSSLWRRKLEIARLSLDYPSLNLVERASDASWNLEALLWKASRTETAPTAARVSASRRRFPYIEATNGRINFKYGLEKSVFSFTDADFTLFSPAENQWRMRLEARPVRTDMPVTDTGTVKTEITMQRALLLRDAPMKGTVTWERVQLGNLTRLIYGEDRGWRGALEVSTQMNGTPGALQFKTAVRLHDLQRFDVTREAANLEATCTGELNVSANQVHNAECRLPLEGGLVAVRGMMQGLRSPRYDLMVTAENLGANSVLNLVTRAKPGLPDDLVAQGDVAASFHGRRMSDAPSEWIGNLVLSGFSLHSAALGKDLTIPKAVAMVNTNGTPGPTVVRRHARPEPAAPPVRALVVEEFDLPLGGSTPAHISGTLDDERFSMHVKGDATLERLQQVARATGIGAPRIALTGPASVDMEIGAAWTNAATPEVNGTAQLKNVRAEVPGVTAPVELSAAHVDFDHSRIALRNATATIGKLTLAGSANFPRFCTAELPCDVRLDLATDEFNPERWNEVLNPTLKKRPWYRLASPNGQNLMLRLHATGHLTAKRWTLGSASGTGWQTDFAVADGILQLNNLQAGLMGGTLAGTARADFTGEEPHYEGTGTASRVQVEKLAPLIKAPLGTGLLTLNYKVEARGLNEAALLKSSVAETGFTWTGGTLRISPDGRAPMRVLSGEGQAKLAGEGWTISGSQWHTPGGIYNLSGTVSRDLALNLEFTQENGAVSRVTGTLVRPQMAPAAKDANAAQPTQSRR